MTIDHSTFGPLSPLDGRYQSTTKLLTPYFSELGLNKYRIHMEVQYWIFLQAEAFQKKFSSHQRIQLEQIASQFSEAQAVELKKLEEQTRHDVKAVEYYVRRELHRLGFEGEEFVHFGLTSEDVNSVAYALAIKEAVEDVLQPAVQAVIDQLVSFAEKEKATPMLARTHGQPAVPTTVGKEVILFARRLHHQLQAVNTCSYPAKLSGAVGNWNAHQLAFPSVDWPDFSYRFLQKLDLELDHFSTQIVTIDPYLQLFHHFSVINSILIDLNQDIWRYISDEYFIQQVNTQEVGSSTMPQKVNPIDFENSEGNLGLANALFAHFSAKLPISRLQRDLSDSTVKRNIGVAFGYALLGYTSCLRGLKKISVNHTKLNAELAAHWEVITEGIQTVLRREGKPDAYELVKDLARGEKLTAEKVQAFIDSLELTETVATELGELHPHNYLGLSIQLVDQAIKELYEAAKK